MEIYKIENLVNGKKYIGQTVKTFNERYNFKGKGIERVLAYLEMRERKRDTYPIKLYTNNHLLSAIRKYGVENFTVEIIDTAETIEELNEKEKLWISHYEAYTCGYNKCFGGENTKGWKPSDKTRKLWVEMRKGTMVGEKNPNYGKKHSEEVRKKMSESRKGKLTGIDHPKAREVINLDTLEVFETLTSACEKYGITDGNLTSVCKRRKRGTHGTRKKAGGYRWMYYDEYIEKGDIVGDTKNNHFKAVINEETGEVFDTIKKASEQYHVDPSQITKVCKGKAKTAGGYKWRYHKE